MIIVAGFKETKVDGAYLQNCALTIDERLSVVQSALVKLDEIIKMLDANWEGNAHKLFMANYTSGVEYSAKWMEAGKQLSEILKKCGQSYSKADDEAMLLVRGLSTH